MNSNFTQQIVQDLFLDLCERVGGPKLAFVQPCFFGKWLWHYVYERPCGVVVYAKYAARRKVS